MSFEQLKQEVAMLDDQHQAELISFALQLRHSRDGEQRREVADRPGGADKSGGLSPDEFERRLDS